MTWDTPLALSIFGFDVYPIILAIAFGAMAAVFPCLAEPDWRSWQAYRYWWACISVASVMIFTITGSR